MDMEVNVGSLLRIYFHAKTCVVRIEVN